MMKNKIWKKSFCYCQSKQKSVIKETVNKDCGVYNIWFVGYMDRYKPLDNKKTKTTIIW